MMHVQTHVFFILNQSFVFTVITKSVRELCMALHCLFLKIISARIPDKRGGPIASNQSSWPKAGSAVRIGYRNQSVNAIRRQNRCSFHAPNGTHKYNVWAQPRML